MNKKRVTSNSLEVFDRPTRSWFEEHFGAPTEVQSRAWPKIAGGEHTLLLAPTGSGKTLAAFMVAIDRLMFAPPPMAAVTRVLYVSPLKALGVDVERNLTQPLAGVQAAAQRHGVTHHRPRVAVRTGDTPSRERQLMIATPPDILITTPESLYLMLTSRAREILARLDTVIVDEIHSLVANKRGAHLFLSLERLVALRRAYDGGVMQRIGLSATQRPLEEVARLLGGFDTVGESPRPRPVSVIDAGRRKRLVLTVDVPVQDMASLQQADTAGQRSEAIPSIWPSIHPRLLALIRRHRSTMIFVNNRRLAERLAASINELADEELALAHHGSVAKDTRAEIEERLKEGSLPAIVATSSMELGIDMGAVDLVVQIEAPPSVASGIQRVGRAGHQVDGVSKAVIFPKYRGDLLAVAAATEAMMAGRVEASTYPRNPLDVLAQQIVAMVAMESQTVDEVFALVRGAAPFAELPRSSFDSVLDLLTGRYPADEFVELRPRLNWNRSSGRLQARRGAQRTAILNGGTIPDRGLYGVFLAEDVAGSGRRVGELDEEMVFETRPGDVFVLGASSWRALEITHDRVMVAPAPGEPGRTPFWRGDGPGRPLEFGRAIGALTRKLAVAPAGEAQTMLVNSHGLNESAARNLLRYIQEQLAAAGAAPDDKTIVIESFLDEVGDWRVTILAPFGARVHAPWAMATSARLREKSATEVDIMWSDDGIVLRLPESDAPPPAADLIPAADEVEELVTQALGGTSLFAARFRENAARALLLPKKYPGRRTPLWVQRRRSADLLSVASGLDNFPLVLETYRECLKDVFDLPGLRDVLQQVEQRRIVVHTVAGRGPSPFSASLLFNYVANFIYDGDAPLAERRAQTLALDQSRLRELLGDAELRELLDRTVVEELGRRLQQHAGHWQPRDADDLHDLLRRQGPLALAEVHERAPDRKADIERWLGSLRRDQRVIELEIGGQGRLAAIEDAGRLHEALDVALPAQLPEVFRDGGEDPIADLVSRYARTHVAFPVSEVAKHFGLPAESVQAALTRLAVRERAVEGEFLPGGREREWCDQEILRTVKRLSLARLRKQVEPVQAEVLGCFLPHWQGVGRKRGGLDALLDVVEQLQGAAIPFSILESQVLAARVADYRSGDLDQLCAAGEIAWQGRERIGEKDGRVALFLTDDVPRLALIAAPVAGELCAHIRDQLAHHGAMFFEELSASADVFPHDLLHALWQMVWAGEVTNDGVTPLRALHRPSRRRRHRQRVRPSFRSRRATAPPGSEGRWSLIGGPRRGFADPTSRAAAMASQLIHRYGVVTRELVGSERVPGGFAALYPVFKAMEDSGKLRRGYFVAGQGAAQFAAPGAEDRLRGTSSQVESHSSLVLASTDPANPYGSAIRWPEIPIAQGRPQRAAGARVILHRGLLVGYLSRSGYRLTTFLSGDGTRHAGARQALVAGLVAITDGGEPLVLAEVDGQPTGRSDLAQVLVEAGFTPSSRGFLRRGQ